MRFPIACEFLRTLDLKDYRVERVIELSGTEE
jgi:hypothetical protein